MLKDEALQVPPRAAESVFNLLLFPAADAAGHHGFAAEHDRAAAPGAPGECAVAIEDNGLAVSELVGGVHGAGADQAEDVHFHVAALELGVE